VAESISNPVGLVDDQNYRLAQLTDSGGDLEIFRCHRPAPIDNEGNEVGFFQRELSLSADPADQRIRIGIQPPGVDQHNLGAGDNGAAVDAIPSNAGLVGDERIARACQRIEQRRLADIRPSGDNHDGQRRAIHCCRHGPSVPRHSLCNIQRGGKRLGASQASAGMAASFPMGLTPRTSAIVFFFGPALRERV